ncbi:esterase/lipase family protein [Flindersiella endophytica]
MTRPHLLFIPGLGDRVWLYRLVTPLWRRLGYEPHIFRFGWAGRADELGARQRALLAYVDAIGADGLYVVGASAGGTAAVNLLSARSTIRNVVTVASPLRPKDRPTVPLLAASIDQAHAFLGAAGPQVRGKIVSVYGLRDWRVPVPKSRRRGLRCEQLPTIGHNATIFLALSVFAGRLRGLL